MSADERERLEHLTDALPRCPERRNRLVRTVRWWPERIARRCPLLCFIALAYGISWTLWSPLALDTRPDTHSWQYLHLFGSLGPGCAGLITAYLYGGHSELRKLADRLFSWRVAPVWHVTAWLSPFGLFAIAVLVVQLAWGQTWEAKTFCSSSEFQDLPLLAYWMASLVFYGWGEETGWRGFALPHLQTRYSALTSTLWVSVMWACWHIPLFWFAPGLSRMGVGEVIGW